MEIRSRNDQLQRVSVTHRTTSTIESLACTYTSGDGSDEPRCALLGKENIYPVKYRYLNLQTRAKSMTKKQNNNNTHGERERFLYLHDRHIQYRQATNKARAAALIPNLTTTRLVSGVSGCYEIMDGWMHAQGSARHWRINPVNRMYDDDNIPLNELNDEWNSKKNNILFLFEVGGL